MKLHKKIGTRIKFKKSHKVLLVYLTIILILLLIFYFFNKQLISIVFTLMLLILGSLSSFFKRITGFNMGIEFITFATILFLYSYGFTFGLIACSIMVIISSLSTGNLTPETFTGYMMYCLIAIVSLFLPFGIALNGIMLVLIMNIVGLLILTILGFNLPKSIIYIVGNTIFNIILFKYFSEIIFSLL